MKKNKKKMSKKGIILLISSFLVGLLITAVSIYLEEQGTFNINNLSLNKITNVSCYILFVIYFVCFILARRYYSKIKNTLNMSVKSFSEERYLKYNKYNDICSFLCSIVVVLIFPLTVLYNNTLVIDTILYLIATPIFFITLFTFIKCLKIQKKLMEKDNIDFFDSKSFIENMDEIQKQMLDKVCRKTFMFMQGFLLILLLLFVFFTSILKLEIGYVLLLGLINIVNYTVYFIYTMKIEHANK